MGLFNNYATPWRSFYTFFVIHRDGKVEGGWYFIQFRAVKTISFLLSFANQGTPTLSTQYKLVRLSNETMFFSSTYSRAILQYRII